jgi:hypothetical protein
MRLASSPISAALFSVFIFLALPAPCIAQKQDSAAAISAAGDLPETPQPQIQIAEVQNPDAQSPPAQTTPPATPAPAQPQASQGSSSSQSPAPQTDDAKARHEKAEEQLKEEEKQRVAGIVPSFNISYRADAVSLSPAQKFRLEFRSIRDPYTFAISGIVAGLAEAKDSTPSFGWGPKGYFERAGAAYLDNVIGNTFGNAVLPSLLHQDPRYFRLGHGTVQHRFLYAVATSFICKHDNTGKWEPNYSNVLGNLIGGEISNFYYPGGSFTKVGTTLGNGLTVTAEGTFGATLQEFWPDISRKLFHKDPTHGLDAQARALDAEEKQKRLEEKRQKKQQQQNEQRQQQDQK